MVRVHGRKSENYQARETRKLSRAPGTWAGFLPAAAASRSCASPETSCSTNPPMTGRQAVKQTAARFTKSYMWIINTYWKANCWTCWRYPVGGSVASEGTNQPIQQLCHSRELHRITQVSSISIRNLSRGFCILRVNPIGQIIVDNAVEQHWHHNKCPNSSDNSAKFHSHLQVTRLIYYMDIHGCRHQRIIEIQRIMNFRPCLSQKV